MKNRVKYIMLVDDNADDNFIHTRVIKKNDSANIVITKQTALEALKYLKSKKDNSEPPPNLIFLDINMPGMNGWEFLEEYNKLAKEFQSHAVVVMLTTSENPADMIKAKLFNEISEFKTKPLTKEMLEEILEKHFRH